ncbi:MAG: GDSL-type esterase/lipase family protein [Myxococcota bacterium]|nr:GDSL-type esterase/lipase family protein [Myxococcota bacterium]
MKLKHFHTAAIILLMVLFSESIHRSHWSQLSESPPSGWEKEPNEIPYKLAALRGDLPLLKGQISLDFYRTIYPQSNAKINNISLTAHLPEDGQIEVWLSSPPRKVREGNRWIDPCQIHPNGPRCGGKSKFGVGIRLDRIGQSEVKALHANAQNERIMKCDGNTPEIGDQPVQIELNRTAQGFSYRIDNITVNCRTQVGDRPPQIRPGLREVHISNLSVNDNIPTQPAPSRLYPYLAVLVAFGTVLFGFKYLNMPQRYITLVFCPLLLSSVLGFVDWKSWVETMRAAWLPYQWMPVILSGTLMVFLTQFSAVFMLVKRDTLPKAVGIGILALTIQTLLVFQISSVNSTICLLPPLISVFILAYERNKGVSQNGFMMVALFGCIGTFFGLALGVNSRHALGGAALFGSALACLSWLQAHASVLKGYNLLSLVTVGLLIFSTESFISGTSAGQQWSSAGALTEKNDLFGWVSTANQGFELLNKGEHTTYPDKGYPVAIPTVESQTRQQRVISFGGSTTGGAFQNDNLEDFYPAKLGRRLGDKYRSINQGVGGWTTFHIARYVEMRAEELSPDVAIFYIGHNDLLTTSPLPYKDLYKRWESNPNRKQLSNSLGRYHLYHALRHILVSLRPAEQRAAVPVSHAEENILRIRKALLPHRSHIILASEGLAPDPGPLADYNELLMSIANSYEGISYLDAANRFHGYPSAKVFLDDCHLSDFGHDLLADWLSEQINSEVNNATNP